MVSSVPARRKLRQIGGGAVAQLPFHAGHAEEVVVVEDHRLPVRGELDIQLDPVARLAGGLESRERILRRAALRPKAAVSHRRVEQKIPGLAEAVLHRTCTTASTSTAKFIGRR
jgi:hypothetical protein